MGKSAEFGAWPNFRSHKRQELIRHIEEKGVVLIRHGARHDWYQNPRSGICQPVPRHREIKEPLAEHILKELGD